jgi:hypothetical protein
MHKITGMKTILLIFLIFPLSLGAQIEIKDQPTGWYQQTWEQHQQKMIETTNLLKMQKQTIPQGFQDTLRVYDWIELGGYLYIDKNTTSGYNQKNPSYHITRLDENDTCLYFSYNATYHEMEKGSISHTNFRITLGLNPVWKVEKQNGAWFIKDINNGDYLHLISYQNGVLVYDIPMNGKTTDKKMFARLVLMAIPKTFTWSKTNN